MSDHGLIPFYWDSGYSGNNGMGLFNRYDGSSVYPELIKTITEAVK